MWAVFAILSAVFAAFTAIFAKIGIEGISSNLATAIRTVIILLITWGTVFVTGEYTGVSDIGKRSWIFLVLSGISTGLSWLFYYKALQSGDAARVAPVDKCSIIITMLLAFLILHEKITVKMLIGGALITAGTLFMIF